MAIVGPRFQERSTGHLREMAECKRRNVLPGADLRQFAYQGRSETGGHGREKASKCMFAFGRLAYPLAIRRKASSILSTLLKTA